MTRRKLRQDAHADRFQALRLPFLSLLVRGGLVVLMVGGLFGLPIAFFVLGVSPSAHFEESVGYRYFYSMRIAFGGEYAWLPQGYLPGLFHVVIQYILSFIGYAPGELFPRIDVFSFLAILLPALISVALVGWTFACYRRISTCILLTVLTIAIFGSSKLPNGWTVAPDYHVWVVPLMFASAGLMLRIPSSRPISGRLLAGAAVLAGTAAATKVTFVTFGLAPFLLLVRKSRSELSRAGVAALSAAMIFIVLAASYFLFNLRWMVDAVDALVLFSKTQAATLPFGSSIRLLVQDPTLIALCTLPPLALGLGAVFRRIELLAAGILGCATLWLVAQRPYSHTLIELGAASVLQISVLLRFLEGRFDSHGHRLHPWIWHATSLCLAVLILVSAAPNMFRRQADLLSYSRVLNEGAAKWRRALNSDGGPVWILTTGNEYRPNSAESALCKGGVNVFDQGWGVSPYIAALFPNFHCAVLRGNLSGVVGPTAVVGFMRPTDEALARARERVREYFSISLDRYRCNEFAAGPTVLVACRQNHEQPELPRISPQ